MRKIYELTDTNGFAGDFILFTEEDELPGNWTVTPLPSPVYTPKFKGVRDHSTGEWTGVWEDVGVPTSAELKEQAFENAKLYLTAEVQKYLDTLARSRGYDSMLSLCTYYGSTNASFAAEGVAGCTLRDRSWEVLYGIFSEVSVGHRTMPSVQEVLDELPAPEWP